VEGALKRLGCIVLLCATLLSGCGTRQSGSGIEVSAAWSRATPPGASVGVVYFDVVNHAGQPDRLLAGSSPAAARVEMHETRIDTNGMMQMRPLQVVDLPPGELLHFAPQGRHMMLTGLVAPLREGTQLRLSLRFERAGTVTVEVPVRGLGAAAAP
jgi:periplasmic copper chaperone A